VAVPLRLRQREGDQREPAAHGRHQVVRVYGAGAEARELREWSVHQSAEEERVRVAMVGSLHASLGNTTENAMNECAVVTKGWIVDGVLNGEKIHSRMYTVKAAADEYKALLEKNGAEEIKLTTVTGFEGKKERR
jgi:hypothetical protein